MRLVDADYFIDKLAIAPLVQEAMRKAVNHIPTVEVIRCKDCIHWYRDYGENKCLEFADIPLEPNDFCSHGERRKDADT